MSSDKRVRVEEYHDPDYSQFHVPKPVPADTKPTGDSNAKSKRAPQRPPPAPIDRRTAIVQVINREFQREMKSKEHELEEISQRLNDAKKLLAKVRFAVVSHYYGKKNLQCSAEETQSVIKCGQDSMTAGPSTSDKLQLPIHPSLKKLLGKRPIDYNEILKSRPTRRAAKNATEQFQKMTKKSNSEAKTKRNHDDEGGTVKCEEPVQKKPRYIAPIIANEKKIDQINSSRGRNHYRHILVVGNTSKFIGDEEAELGTNVTHKWLIYIETKTGVPIERIVSRARYHLHDSYKPNDVIDVNYPPFRLSKRGWGEFPVRIQLFFHEHLGQKPLQIFHTLALDKKRTGLQSLGAETIVELWLNIPTDEPTKSTEQTTIADVQKFSEISQTVQQPETSIISEQFIKNEPSLDMSFTNVPLLDNTLDSLPILVDPFKNEPLLEGKLLENIPMPAAGSTLKFASNLPMPISMNMERSAGFVPMAASANLPYVFNQITPVPLKTESNGSGFKAIDPQQQASTSKQPIEAANQSVVKKPVQAKKLIKCIDKSGKVSFVELVQDPSNPKVFKMIVPKVVSIAKNSIPAAGATPATSANGNGATTELVSDVGAPSTSAATAIRQKNHKVFAIDSTKVPVQLQLQHKQPQQQHQQPQQPQTGQQRPAQQQHLQPQQKSQLKQMPPAHPKHPQALYPLTKRQILPKPSQPQQQSLLKPQISLLKLSQSAKAPVKVIRVNNIAGLKNRNINVFVPSNLKVHSSNAGPAQPDEQPKESRNLDVQLETEFCGQSFNTVTMAVNWLLKRLPLISSNASYANYRQAFPFVTRSLADFKSFHLAKQRSFEWLRAKYVSRTVSKHKGCESLPKWSTKEIILFGRWHAYTPLSLFETIKPKSNADKNVHEMVKSELEREQQDSKVISVNTQLTNWLDGVEKQVKTVRSHVTDTEVIDVEECSGEALGEEKARLQKNKMGTGNCGFVHPIEKSWATEVMWVDDICRRSQINLQPEEIADGVSYRGAELVMAHGLRSFVDDLLRRCIANKMKNNNNNSVNMDIRNDDILQTLSQIPLFDFLTNKNLGIESNKSA